LKKLIVCLWLIVTGVISLPVNSLAAEFAGIDSDGVAMLLPSAAGSHFTLGSQNPNTAALFEIERKTTATPHTQDGVLYWTVAAHKINYASGGAGNTTRLHIHASGGVQQFTWKTQRGFLSNERDLRNQEFTAYVRVRGVTEANRAAISLKIRGGAHSENNPDLASCTMMTYQAATMGAVARFGKELRHPTYDYVKLTPRFDAALVPRRWVGLKLVSFSVAAKPARVVNRIYLDSEPFTNASGKPRNDWRLFAEYTDIEGLSTGHYSKLVDWGGWQTTLRTDGIASLDFTLISVREISPPAK